MTPWSQRDWPLFGRMQRELPGLAPGTRSRHDQRPEEPASPATSGNSGENNTSQSRAARSATLVGGAAEGRRTSSAAVAVMLGCAVVTILSATGHSLAARTRFTPFFAAVRAKPANVRRGPGTDYAIKWTYVRRWEPVEVYERYGNWRRIRDWQGNTGWMLGALLTTRTRTALVAPWSRRTITPLRDRPSQTGRIVAWLEPRVMAKLGGCDGTWCQSSVRSIGGFIAQTRLWGAYPSERF